MSNEEQTLIHSPAPACITRLSTFAQYGQPKPYAMSDMMRQDIKDLLKLMKSKPAVAWVVRLENFSQDSPDQEYKNGVEVREDLIVLFNWIRGM
jgi:hypothetical protein